MNLPTFKTNYCMYIFKYRKSLHDIHIKKLNISNPQKYIMKYK